MWLFVRWRNVRLLALIVVVMATAIAPIYVAADPKPDVVPSALTLGTGSLTIGSTAPLKVVVTNRGRGTAYDVAVTISIAAGGTASRVSQISVGNLGAGASTTVVTSFTAPSQPGTYDVIASTTVRRDANQTNNSTAVSLQVTGVATVASISTPPSTSSTGGTTSSSGSTTSSTGGTTSSTGGTTSSTGGTTSSTGGTTSSTGGTTSSTGGTTSSTGGTTSSTGGTTSSTGGTTSSTGGTTSSTGGTTNGTAYYVGTSGSDANSCASAQSSTPSNRKRTIRGGISCLASGDTLIIGAGVYDESIPPDVIPSGSGTGGEAPEAPWPGATVIRAETPCSGTSCTTTIRPSSVGRCWASVAAIAITNTTQAKYIIFQGFEADANSVCANVARFYTQYSVASPHHIRVQNVYWHDALGAQGGTGLIIVGASPGGSVPSQIEVLDSTIKNLNVAGSFPTQGGNHCLYWDAHGTIRRNVIAQCSPTDHNGQGIATHSGPGGYTVDISGNDVSGFGFWGIEAAATLNTKIYNNVVHDGGGTNTQCTTAQVPCAGIVVNGSGGATNTLVANNTVYNVSSGNGLGITGRAIMVLFSGTTNTTIQNNILYGGTNDTITSGDGGTISNNRCAGGCATADNPQFVNPAAGDVRLSASSPTTITQSGVNLSSSFTIDKSAMAWGSTWGLGAYKYR